MKKIFAGFLCAAMAFGCVAGLGACGSGETSQSSSSVSSDSTVSAASESSVSVAEGTQSSEVSSSAETSAEQTTRYSYSFYMPDGAPALAAAMLMAEDTDLGADVTYNVVDSSLIASYVTGNSPDADVCILPLSVAAAKLGTGTTYQMLGTVTHGNLYIVSKTETTQITTANLSDLIGKTVGVVQLAAVPGLTFEVILSDNDIDYNIVGNDGATSDTAVNLIAMSAASDVSSFNYDYYIIPEPAMTTLTNKMSVLKCLGDLQELYGGDNGYPQAVMVAKTEVIEKDPQFIQTLISAMQLSAEWLKSDATSMDTIVSAVSDHLTDGLSPTFSAANLNSTVIANCAIYFSAAADCKAEITSFLEKYSAVSGTTYSVSDGFFYGVSAS